MSTTMKSSLWIVCATMAVIASLLMVSCGGREEAPITVPAGAQAGDLVDLGPCIYNTGVKEHTAECGTLIVPENRADPDSRLIALPVTRIKAAGSTPAEAIFWFSGGPGGPNRISYPLDGLTENHDFVMVGYRGAEGQVVLACPEISQAISDAPGTLLSPESLAAYAAGSAQCAQRLESEGIDLAGYTIIETIDDMEAARIALGYEKINLYGNIQSAWKGDLVHYHAFITSCFSCVSNGLTLEVTLSGYGTVSILENSLGTTLINRWTPKVIRK